MQEAKECASCVQWFIKNKFVSKKQWAKTKYCSVSCAGKGWVGHKAPKTAFKRGSIPWNKGVPVAFNNKLAEWRKETGGEGKAHPNWKGDNASYSAIHTWVSRHKKKPDACTNCKKPGNPYQIHWSNVDHQYKRNLEDYIALCARCHKRYDLDNELATH